MTLQERRNLQIILNSFYDINRYDFDYNYKDSLYSVLKNIENDFNTKYKGRSVIISVKSPFDTRDIIKKYVIDFNATYFSTEKKYVRVFFSSGTKLV